MAEQAKPMGFAARMKTFFGFLPGQGLPGFAAELKALTPAEKAFFVAEFNAAGMPMNDPEARPAPVPE
jgi:hypothetical protein